MTQRAWAAVVLALVASPAWGQESQFHADLRREGEHIAASCSEFSVGKLGACAYTLLTDSPFHIALGSLAPGNGFATGLAFSTRFTPNESWRLSWTADGVVTPGGSWRGGAYMKLVHTPDLGIVVVPAGGGGTDDGVGPREFTVIDLFAQKTSLATINYFGQGPASLEQGQSVFGEDQTIIGGSVIHPVGGRVFRALRTAVIGGVRGRFVDIRPGRSDSVPSIEQLYTDRTAPGLGLQRGFVEFQEGLRLKPSIAGGWLRLNYLLSAQQFRASREALSSFNRWTIDLQHEIPLYRRVSSTGPRDFNGPNQCGQAAGAPECPPVSWSRNRQGAVGARLLVSSSKALGGHRVPFYFQPTLGGSDLNSERILAGFADYRFRGPHMIAVQGSFEHSIWGPIGVFVQGEQGKVASDRGDLDFAQMARSATIGVTLRAGGLPMMNFSFSWGREGHHIIGNVNNSLLGGSTRPSLF